MFFCLCVPLSRGLLRAVIPIAPIWTLLPSRWKTPNFAEGFQLKISERWSMVYDGVMVSEQSMEEFLGMLLHGMGAEPRPFQNVQSI